MIPDQKQRNELKFKILRGIPYTVRVCIVLGLWFTGFAIQALGWLLPGVAVIFAGTLLALTRGYSNEPPKRRRGKKRWENVTLDQFRRIGELDKESRRWDRSAWIDITNVWGFLLAGFGIAALVIGSGMVASKSLYLGSVCLADGVVLFMPFWITGIRRFYHRTELMISVRALENVLQRLERPDAKGLMATPMLELQRTKNGELPNDVKLMVRFDDASDDFMGIQVQVSLNNVQGTKYPYLYCVILAKPHFQLPTWDTSKDVHPSKITIEKKQTDEVDIIVVRQRTTRKSGYHTKRAAQVRVFDAAAAICRRNLQR